MRFLVMSSVYVQVLEHEAAYLATLPQAEMYERSYMHRDAVTHVVVAQVSA